MKKKYVNNTKVRLNNLLSYYIIYPEKSTYDKIIDNIHLVSKCEIQDMFTTVLCNYSERFFKVKMGV